MSELKPCPHCGESLVEHADHHGTWWAHKNEPAPCAHGVTQLFDNEDLEAWNRRTPSLPASAEGVEAILHAALDCPHEIDGEKVVLKASLSKPGNALAQLSTRLSAALKAETSR